MKKLLIILFSCFSGMAFGQVTSVDFLMKYNCQTSQYDISLVVLEGNATSIPHRAQFNSQISILVPAGQALSITNEYMPLQNNQNYNSTVPMDWVLSSPTYAPAAMPGSDFYSIVPKLNVASFYNDLEAGDVIKIFSISVGDSGEYDENVRFFNNGTDPDYESEGMNGADYSNGFTLGGPVNIYNNHAEEPCSITTTKESVLEGVKVFPNPIQNELSVEIPQDVDLIRVVSSNGTVHFQTTNKSKGIVKINAAQFPAGIYYVQLESGKETSMHKVVKF